MSFHHLDQYAGVPSAFTKTAPAARVLGTAVIAVGAAVLPMDAWIQLGCLALLVAGLLLLARVPPSVFVIRIAPPLGFVVLASAAVLVFAPGEGLIGFGRLRITDVGIDRFAGILARGGVALGAAVLLVSTTRFTQLVEALRELRLPAVVTASLGLAYRFLYVLTDEVERLRRAARSRNAAAGAAGRRKLLFGVTAAALTRSVSRSERVYQSMLARGYAGRLAGLEPHPMDRRSATAVTALAAGVAAIVVSAYVL